MRWKKSVLDIGSIFVPLKNFDPRMNKAVMKDIGGILNFLLALMGVGGNKDYEGG